MKILLFIAMLIVVFMSCRDQQQSQSTSKPKINHTALYVTNLKTSADFYRTIIGLDTIPEPFHDGRHAWFSLGNNVALHIIQGAEEKKEYYKNQHTCFSIGSVEEFTEVLNLLDST
jgi:lactoylglutathione lyase